MLSNIKILLSAILFGTLFLSGCVDEPEIDPVKIPYSQVKIANFSTNIDNISISVDNTNDNIDNQIPLSSFNDLGGNSVDMNLQRGEFTNYFDITSGERIFKVENSSGEVLYKSNLFCESYGELIVIFAGYHYADEDYSTFAPFTVWMGKTYLDDYHQMPDENNNIKYFLEQGESVLKIVHASASITTPTTAVDAVPYNQAVLNYNISPDSSLSATLIELDYVNNLDYSNYIGGVVPGGNYDVELSYFVKGSDIPDSIATEFNANFDVQPNTNTLFILYGAPDNPVYTIYQEEITTEIRPK